RKLNDDVAMMTEVIAQEQAGRKELEVKVMQAMDQKCLALHVELAKEKGAKRAVLLPVSAPFHCQLMEPAAEVMAKALAEVDINRPVVPVVANVVAEAVSDPATIRSLLVNQVTGSVRWRESVAWMAGQGVDAIWEVGAGKALSGMVRRIERSIACTAIGTPEDVQKAVASLA
ncbi:MAG: malonyl CoA-acyl carrier protein transacylase, partial [Pseudomonadota bacterium]|nr:malonyl CoA-acyl carrier protein transacylase [Pseudomonadota bacterium]